MIPETMIIETENGPVKINKCDFDADRHVVPTSAPIPEPVTKAEFSAALKEWGVEFNEGLKLDELKKLYTIAKLDQAVEGN